MKGIEVPFSGKEFLFTNKEELHKPLFKMRVDLSCIISELEVLQYKLKSGHSEVYEGEHLRSVKAALDWAKEANEIAENVNDSIIRA